ncbi:MATE family efflux transporter [Chloroflexota bacterium]
MRQNRDIDAKGQQRRQAMGLDPIWRLILRFSGPAVISMTVASSYQLVDAIFVGRLGTGSLAAMSVTYPLVLSFVAIGSGTGTGVTSLISRTLGAGDSKGADKVSGVAISLCFLISGIIALFCLPNLDTILRTLGASGSVLPLANKYTSILIQFRIFSYLSMIMSSLIRADGNPVFSSIVAISSSVINIALDPILIFGLGPIPAMGISGAAIATVIAQGISTIVYIIFIIKGRTAYHFRPSNFWPSLTIIAGIYRVGVASIVRSAAQFVVMGVVNRTAVSFGITPLAIMGALVRIGRFVLMPCLGLGQGMLPLIGYNYGASKKDRLSEIIFKAGTIGVIWTSLCWMLIMLFPEQVISAFNAEADFLNEGAKALRLYSIMYFALGIQMVPGFFFQGIGKGLPSTVLSAARQVVFILPSILLLPRFLGLTGLWISYPIADALGLMLGVGWMAIELRKQKISLLLRKS